MRASRSLPGGASGGMGVAMSDTLDERYHALLNSGELYDSSVRELTSLQHVLVERLRQYNATPETPEGLALRKELLPRLLGGCGKNVCLTPPVQTNWGLAHVYVGSDVYFILGLASWTTPTSASATDASLVRVSPSARRSIRSTRPSAPAACSTTCPCTSAMTCGWGRCDYPRGCDHRRRGRHWRWQRGYARRTRARGRGRVSREGHPTPRGVGARLLQELRGEQSTSENAVG